MGCKYGKLKKPYRDSKGRMRRCRKKPKRRR